MMPRQIKSVSLEPRQFEIAERMPNFSSFVQQALDNYAAEIGQGIHTHAPEHRTHGKCNPMGAQYCKICWPTGRPDRDDWFMFLEDPSFEIIPSQAGRYKHFIQQSFAYNEPHEKSSQTVSDDVKPKIGWIRRFLRQLF